MLLRRLRPFPKWELIDPAGAPVATLEYFDLPDYVREHGLVWRRSLTAGKTCVFDAALCRWVDARTEAPGLRLVHAEEDLAELAMAPPPAGTVVVYRPRFRTMRAYLANGGFAAAGARLVRVYAAWSVLLPPGAYGQVCLMGWSIGDQGTHPNHVSQDRRQGSSSTG